MSSPSHEPQRTDDIVGVLDSPVDRAVATAVDVLDEMVCECGHIEAEHYFDTPDGPTTHQPCDDSCDCRVFRPVLFSVYRAETALTLLALIYQYRDDMRHGVSELGARGRRLEAIEAAIAKAEGR